MTGAPLVYTMESAAPTWRCRGEGRGGCGGWGWLLARMSRAPAARMQLASHAASPPKQSTPKQPAPCRRWCQTWSARCRRSCARGWRQWGPGRAAPWCRVVGSGGVGEGDRGRVVRPLKSLGVVEPRFFCMKRGELICLALCVLLSNGDYLFEQHATPTRITLLPHTQTTTKVPTPTPLRAESAPSPPPTC